MKQLLLLFLIFSSIITIGQNAKQATKISIGYNFSPDYNFRTLKNNNGNSSTDLVISSRNDIEKAKFGYTTGFDVTFHFSDLLNFQTGIQYSNKGYKTREQDLSYFQTTPTDPNKIAIKYSYQYIGIPLQAKFYFGKSKARFISGVGVVTNFLVNTKNSIMLKYLDGRTEKKNESSSTGINKIDISPLVSIGVDYKLTNKINILIEPTFRFGLIETNEAPVNEKLWSAGAFVGLSYYIK